MKQIFTSLALLTFSFLVSGWFCPSLWAQDPRGTIVGRIADTTGGVIPGVTVQARNLATNVMVATLTNDVGLYEIRYLLPGSYEIRGELAGFKTWVRPSVELRTGDRIAIDIVLEVGEPSDVVQVTTQTPVLDTTGASLGEVLTSRQVSELPARNGNLSWVFGLVPGVVLGGIAGDGPWNPATASNVMVSGAGPGAFDYSVDGVSNNSYSGQPALIPPAEMVQEVQIQTSPYDAQVGHTLAGAISISMKSGTNKLHGTVGFSGANGPMFARSFFVNNRLYDPATGPVTDEKIKASTPPQNWYQYDASVGGPVYLPGLYDGRDKTFWMFGWQSHNRDTSFTNFFSVPTEAMRNGDFSALLALGPSYQIYDPATTVPAPNNRVRRQPFAGNIIPQNRIDPVARKLLKYYPAPNVVGTADFQNNYSVDAQDTKDLYQPIVRVDHNFSENWRMFVRYSHSDFLSKMDKVIPGSEVRGRLRRRPHRGVALDNVFVMSPRLVLDVRYGLNWFREHQTYENLGWDLTEFGFPASLIGQLDAQGVTFPLINVAGMLPLGNDGGFSQKYYQHTLLNVLTWTRKSHSIKTGIDGRLIFENAITYGNVSPRLDFAQAYTRGPLDNSPVAPAGQGVASFLLGIPSGGWADVNDSRAESTRFYGLFIQDDWRVAPSLTLNLGLRWEYESPITERFNRTTRQFDFLTPNPIQAQAQANYAKNPIPEIPVGQFQTLGGVTFAGVGGNPRLVREPHYQTFMPRIGFAYNFKRKMVVRGGYGLFYGLLGSEWTDTSQPGYNYRTNIIPSNDSGQTYIASISNPLPNGLTRPAGSSGGLTTFLGLSPAFFEEDGRRPYNQRWSLNVQWEPTARNVIEIGYIGSRAVRLRSVRQLNPVPAQYLSTSPARDQQRINFLSALVTNPFKGIAAFQGSSFYSANSLSRSQLLRPYPHFGDLSTQVPTGSAWYHAGTLRYERRFAKGLQVSANYTWSKTMQATTYLNETDPVPEHVISGMDHDHHLTVNSLYELPFGKGRLMASSAPPWLDHIIGGWQLQAIYQAQSGAPLQLGNVIFTGNPADLALSGDERSIYRWFDTGIFERDPQKQLASNIRTVSSRTAAVREPGIDIWDLSIMKKIRLREGLRLQLQCEAQGAMNHPYLFPPNMNPANSLFGTISRIEGERTIFAGMKLIF